MRQENLYGRFGSGLEPVVRVEPGESVDYGTPNAMWDREDADPAIREVPRLVRPEGAGHATARPV